jgi:hypothetical protein
MISPDELHELLDEYRARRAKQAEYLCRGGHEKEQRIVEDELVRLDQIIAAIDNTMTDAEAAAALSALSSRF